jgi:lysophospholipase L1-like esterase
MTSGLWHPVKTPQPPDSYAEQARIVGGGRYVIQQLQADVTAGIGLTYKNLHRLTCSCVGLRLFFFNSGYHGGGQMRLASSVNYLGELWPVTFRGQYEWVLDIGGGILSDPIDLPYNAGDPIFDLTFTQPTTPGDDTTLNTSQTQPGEGNNLAGGGDSTQTGANMVTVAANGFGPTFILATPTDGTRPPSITAAGDSIQNGSQDTALAGYLARALNAAPFQNGVPAAALIYLSLGGEGGQGYSYPDSLGVARDRMALLQTSDYVSEQYGINDINGLSLSLAALQAEYLSLLWIPMGLQRGKRIIRDTVLPSTASTGPQELVREQFNTWLRAGAPLRPGTLTPDATVQPDSLLAGRPGHPLFAIFDGCPAVENPLNSGNQIPGMFADGTHPNATGHAAIGALFNPAAYLS